MIQSIDSRSTMKLNQDNAVEQRSPTFLAPGMGFVGDNFSMEGGVLGSGGGLGGNASNGARWGRQMKLRPPLTSCSPLRSGS